MYALAGKDTKGLAWLLSHSGDPNRRTDDGNSAVSLAARRKDPEALKVVLAHGGNPNLPRFVEGPWYWCIGPAPIYDAIRCGSVEGLRALIHAGAGLNLPPFDSAGRNTPLIEAVRLSQYEIVYVLLDAGADVHRVNAEGHTVMDELFSKEQHNQKLTAAQAKQRQRCIEFLETNGISLTKQKHQWAEFERQAAGIEGETAE